MKRLLLVTAAALVGSAAGMVARQLTFERADDEASSLVVSAPLTNVIIGAGIGLAAGADGPIMAFMTAFAMSGAVGTDLDDLFPELEPITQKLRYPPA